MASSPGIHPLSPEWILGMIDTHPVSYRYIHSVFFLQLHKIREAREAVDARFAENALQLMERQAEKQTSATRR